MKPAKLRTLHEVVEEFPFQIERLGVETAPQGVYQHPEFEQPMMFTLLKIKLKPSQQEDYIVSFYDCLKPNSKPCLYTFLSELPDLASKPRE